VIADGQPGLSAADDDHVVALARGGLREAAETPESLTRFDERLDAGRRCLCCRRHDVCLLASQGTRKAAAQLRQDPPIFKRGADG
jgi:hypothetical protein